MRSRRRNGAQGANDMASRRFKFTVCRTKALLHRVQSNLPLSVCISLLRIRVTQLTLPVYCRNVRLPTFGMLREGLRAFALDQDRQTVTDEKSTRLNSSHL